MNFFTKIWRESIPFSQYKQEKLGIYNPPKYTPGTNTPYQPMYSTPVRPAGVTREQLVAQAVANHNAQMTGQQPPAMSPPMTAPPPGAPMSGAPRVGDPRVQLPRDPSLYASALRA